ncbi:hypothetical protein CBR_g29655 [Chara braunii]|uniref:Uncharacterized protein n=1 Tax=Chara braunii TaxID=69332 RepID=A0A388LB22_CHABU|nr:hypothetical protein CBR_g29655 [Chara braunii]|eukprot:GBG79508.1 hypothetical protein CBR_g29655 [Chara braunii]
MQERGISNNKAKEKAAKEEAEKKKREQEDEERRERERRDRESFHGTITKELSTKLNVVVGAIEKKGDESEVARLKAEIERLKCAQSVAGPSSYVTKPLTEGELFEKFRREQAELKMESDQRFTILEEEIAKVNQMRDEVVADAEAWKNEALRPGNKRGNLVIGTPVTAQTRPRMASTPATATAKRGVDDNLKGVVERHIHEVDLLKEMRVREVNERREVQQELERVKDK